MSRPRKNPALLQVPLYVAGKSSREAAERSGVRHAQKMASNENPLGASPLALIAMQRALADAHLYPAGAERDLCFQLAAFHGSGLDEHHFLIGNGATDVLRLIAQCFIFDGGEAIMGRLSFPMYRILTLMFGGESILAEPTPTWDLDLDAMASQVGEETRIIWLCSPNNPTGLILTDEEVRRFLGRLPEHVIVVIDESYFDFVESPQAVNAAALVREFPNLISVRSFSKTAGLANLRIGYGIAQPEWVDYLRHARPPFNTGAPVMQAAAAGLQDTAFRERSRELVIQERNELYRALADLGVQVLPSQANFLLLMEVPGGGEVFAESLLQLGYIVRPMGAFGMPDAVRVSVGTHQQNNEFLGAIRTLLIEAVAGE